MQEIVRLFGPSRAQGPSPTFDTTHLILAVLTVGEEGSIGRGALAEKLGLGEGAIRTVLKKLRDSGYIDANASGCYLTAKGRQVDRVLGRSLSRLADIGESDLTVGKNQVALAVRGKGKSVGTGIEQRDSAVKAGASGTTTYVVGGGKFTVPGGSKDCEADFPGPVWKDLRRELEPRNGDAIILSGSDDIKKARLGALAAALTL
ncbi:MAG: hypothetical protein HY296_05415 [Thaumarchaeota archaeon]|nr:hypothetical protein [Nitrososphaerota archaeon]